MKKQFLILTLCAVSLSLAAQRYEPVAVEAHRIEVTHAWDRLIPARLDSLIQPYRAGVDSLRSPVLGESAMTMTAGRPESLLSNWMSDVLRQHSGTYGREADMGLCNVGGLRSAMPKGAVTVGDVFEIAPFENRFCLISLRGSDVLDLFAQMAHSGGEGISGAQLNISANGTLLSATVRGKAVKSNKVYTIATIDYLAEGNDGLVALKKAVKRERKQELVRDVLMDAIRSAHAANRPITAQIEGRITVDGKWAGTDDADGKAGAGEQASLFIVHTNDTHSQIEPINPNSSNRERADKAGYLRRVGLIDMLRSDHPELLLVDCGDFSQGSTYYNLYKGEVEIKLMNEMRYDAATIGNHEFDFGVENMARIFRMANFPILCCNYDFGTTPLRDLVKPAVVIERAGLRIGLLGVCPKLEGLVQTANYEGITYRDPIAAAQVVADSLRTQEHCDLVIVLSHLGWDVGLSDDMNDQRFIAATRDIDLVIGGHSHSYFEKPRYVNNADGKPVPCNQMGKSAQWVGTLSLTLQEKNAK